MKKQYWLTALLLLAFVRADFLTVPAYEAWDPKQVTFDEGRNVFIDWHHIPYDNFILLTRNKTERDKLFALYDGPRDIPAKKKCVVSIRTTLFCEKRDTFLAGGMLVTRPTLKRRCVLINVEQTINENIPEDDRQYRVWPHLGLLFVGTVAHEEGWEVVMWDELVKGFAPMEALIKSGDVVGFSCVVTGMNRAVELARQAKRLGATYTIAGNDSAIFRANQILALEDSPIDAVFTSNSLISVRRFFRTIGQTPLESVHIPGVQIRSGERQRSNIYADILEKRKERARLIAEGDADLGDVFIVPKLDIYPHWKEVWANYRKTFGHKHSNHADVKNALGLLAQGCTRAAGGVNCFYCTIEGTDDIRKPSREYLVQTADAYKKFGIDMVFNTTDSVYEMTAVPHALRELGATWKSMTIYGRAHGLAHHPEYLSDWQGVATERLLVNVGMDSGDERILSAGVVKASAIGSRLDENYQAVRNIKASGAHLHFSLIFGSPGETIETCESSIRFLEWVADTLGQQLDICETDYFWLNFGSPASEVFYNFAMAERLAASVGRSLTREEWHTKFEAHRDALVVPDSCQLAWYEHFTHIDRETAGAYNARCQEIMKKINGSIRGRAYNPV